MLKKLRYYKPSLGQSWALTGLLILGSLAAGAGEFLDMPFSLTYLMAFVFPLGYAWIQGRRSEELDFAPVPLEKPDFGRLPAFTAMALAFTAMLAMNVICDPLTAWIPMPESFKHLMEKEFIDSPLWDMVLSTCILAPLCEELLCRGIMLRGMLETRSPRSAIFWSAFIFGVMHLNPWQTIPAFMIGLLMGWIYWRTRSLLTTVIMHAANNTMSTILFRSSRELEIDSSLRDILPGNTTYLLLIAVSLIILTTTIYILHEKTVSPEIQKRVEG